MTDDIVTRLRRVYVQNTVADLCVEAADEIEHLRIELAEVKIKYASLIVKRVCNSDFNPNKEAYLRAVSDED